jgi:Protein of unknown function (DUF3102)
MDAQTEPRTSTPGSAPGLEKLAAWINKEYVEIESANSAAKEMRRNIVERAIVLGQKLNEAKDKVGHGSWLSWLALNCRDVAERTAQQYMELAKNEAKFRKEMKSASNADLTLAQAFRLIKEPGGSNKRTPRDRFENAWIKLDLPDQEAFVETKYNELAKLMKEVERKAKEKAA